VRKGTYKEIGKHFLTIAVIFLSVGLITPLFQEEELNLSRMIGSLLIWALLFAIGVYFVNRGESDG